MIWDQDLNASDCFRIAQTVPSPVEYIAALPQGELMWITIPEGRMDGHCHYRRLRGLGRRLLDISQSRQYSFKQEKHTESLGRYYIAGQTKIAELYLLHQSASSLTRDSLSTQRTKEIWYQR